MILILGDDSEVQEADLGSTSLQKLKIEVKGFVLGYVFLSSLSSYKVLSLNIENTH